MLRELKFSSVTAHVCVVTVVECAGGPNWSAPDAVFRTTAQRGLSSMSRPPAEPLGWVTWGLSGSWRSRDTRTGAAHGEIFSVLEKRAILACDVPR